MKQQIPVLLQHDIVDHVLSYCAALPLAYDAAEGVGSTRILVPRESAWLTTAALTCKSWLEPALRHLYRTINLCENITEGPNAVPLDLFHRIGYRVRNVVMIIDPRRSFFMRRREILSFTLPASKRLPLLTRTLSGLVSCLGVNRHPITLSYTISFHALHFQTLPISIFGLKIGWSSSTRNCSTIAKTSGDLVYGPALNLFVVVMTPTVRWPEQYSR
jgi:hypothetical protein